MLTRKIVLAAAFLSCGGHAAQQNTVRPSLVSRDVARSLVVAALRSQSGEPTKLPGFHVELMKKSINEQFYFFEATWSNPDLGSVIIGHYSVDPTTADVWNGVVCSEITSPTLSRLQTDVRRELGITPDKYKKLRRPGPMC